MSMVLVVINSCSAFTSKSVGSVNVSSNVSVLETGSPKFFAYFDTTVTFTAVPALAFFIPRFFTLKVIFSVSVKPLQTSVPVSSTGFDISEIPKSSGASFMVNPLSPNPLYMLFWASLVNSKRNFTFVAPLRAVGSRWLTLIQPPLSPVKPTLPDDAMVLCLFHSQNASHLSPLLPNSCQVVPLSVE